MMETREKLELLGPLRCDGIGGMALAQHEGRRVAVRWFPLGGPGAAAAAALEALPAHPAVPALVGRGSDPASEWTAFDWPEGDLLSKKLEQGPLSKQAVLSLGAELAGVFAALHAGDVSHGELSLESVLLAADGRTLLTDLLPLVANRVTDRRGETRALAALTATVDFFSPERAKGGAPSAAADVYALGALLCAAGVGKVESAPAIERLHAIVAGTYWPAVPASLDGDLAALITTMLAPSPEARPPAAEVERRLRELLVPDPFQALLDSQEVSAKGMTPGHEATIQDAVLRAPTRVDVQPYIPLEAFRPEPVSEPAAPAVTAPEHTPTFERERKSGPKPAPPLLVAPPSAAATPPPERDQLSGPKPLPLVMVASELAEPAPVLVAPKLVALPSAPLPTAPEHTPSTGRQRRSGPKPMPPMIVEPPVEARPTTPSARHAALPPAPPPTIPVMRAVVVSPNATQQIVAPPKTRRSGVESAGVLGWFAATNARLGVVAVTAALSMVIGLAVFGEYQMRAEDHEAAARKPDGAALEREAKRRLEEAPPSAPSPAELRKGTEAADEF